MKTGYENREPKERHHVAGQGGMKRECNNGYETGMKHTGMGQAGMVQEQQGYETGV